MVKHSGVCSQSKRKPQTCFNYTVTPRKPRWALVLISDYRPIEMRTRMIRGIRDNRRGKQVSSSDTSCQVGVRILGCNGVLEHISSVFRRMMRTRERPTWSRRDASMRLVALADRRGTNRPLRCFQTRSNQKCVWSGTTKLSLGEGAVSSWCSAALLGQGHERSCNAGAPAMTFLSPLAY